MRTSLDSNILFDVFLPDPLFEKSSREAIEKCSRTGGLVVTELVYAELAAWFSVSSELDQILEELGIAVEEVSRAGAFVAGRAWKKYREAGGPRTRIMTDFLIGGHALKNANQLLTRDRGFYHNYFSGLRILDPSKHRAGS